IFSLVVPRCAEILQGNSDISEIIFQPETRGLNNFLRSFKLISLLRKKRFDIVFLLTASFTRSLLIFLAGIPLRVGYKKGRKSIFLNKKINPSKVDVHRAEHFLGLTHFLGVEKERGCYFFVSSDDEYWADNFLKENKIDKNDFLLILNPGGNWELKRWPLENFALLGDKFIQKYKAKVIISGSKKDKELAEQISVLMQNRPILAAGKTTLKQLGALFKKTDLVIANDSGPMHIAVALDCKVIALFGPTSFRITGPYSEQKNWSVIQKGGNYPLPCYGSVCPQERSMQAISVDEVLAKIDINNSSVYNKRQI
ncbi:MAG: lipopolysaccharide heptosyltransferase II, partial [Candidatus Omnitrophica bacterium]|nr:lipopolysaccharide heptosyltransferase II [Candidatus Omnitrophota bacterium]